jgi:RNA polymerase sigma-70 factor (ECF subfamily)
MIQKVRAGNEHAFKQMFVSNYSEMLRFAHSIVLDKQIAENIVEDIFVNIWVKRADWNIKQNLKSYLLRSVKNGCLNHIKHLSIQNQHALNIQENITEVKTPYDLVISEEFSNEVLRAIEKLPNRVGEVFKLHRFENLKYSEIAAKLNLSIGTVETHMVRALKFLRKRLSSQFSI